MASRLARRAGVRALSAVTPSHLSTAGPRSAQSIATTAVLAEDANAKTNRGYLLGVAAAIGAGLGLIGNSRDTASAETQTLYGMVADISQRLKKIERAMGLEFSEALDLIAAAHKSNPDNIMASCFDLDYFNSLDEDKKRRLLQICRSGYENPDSGMGAYAMNPNDYEEFKPFMDKIIRKYHKVPVGQKHVTDWSLKGVAGLPADGVLDLTKLGLGTTSMRVRVGRNLSSFPLPGAMSKDDRIRMEATMVEAFKKLIADPAYGGSYHSLTPGHPNQLSDAEYEALVKAHIMFKDMAADPYLASAGISSDWPYGRGCYVSADKGFIVWVGEEDHLRIMCMKNGTKLNDVFDRLKSACTTMESIKGLKFAHSEEYGFVTSCPTNLGTGMRASVHIALPNLTKDGNDVTEAKKMAKQFGLSVRGIGGEHTAAGKGGIVDISPSARFCIKEAEIISALYRGIEAMMAAEKKMAAGTNKK
eukprot:jgi/Mesvir1/16117/Mv08402-RA.1